MKKGSESQSTPLTHYDVLEVAPTSALETIKAAYQEKARKYHPDKNGNEELFLRIQAAWECLRDTGAKRDYDATLAKKEVDRSKSQRLSRDEWELVEEEDSGELCYVYACRCGEDIWLPQTRLLDENGDRYCYVTCPGCSLVFHVVRKEFSVSTGG